jgi:hypothetical protein
VRRLDGALEKVGLRVLQVGHLSRGGWYFFGIFFLVDVGDHGGEVCMREGGRGFVYFCLYLQGEFFSYSKKLIKVVTRCVSFSFFFSISQRCYP